MSHMAKIRFQYFSFLELVFYSARNRKTKNVTKILFHCASFTMVHLQATHCHQPAPLCLCPVFHYDSLFHLVLVLFLFFLQLKFLCPFSPVFYLLRFRLFPSDFFLSFYNSDFVFLLYQITYMLSEYVYFLFALKFLVGQEWVMSC